MTMRMRTVRLEVEQWRKETPIRQSGVRITELIKKGVGQGIQLSHIYIHQILKQYQLGIGMNRRKIPSNQSVSRILSSTAKVSVDIQTARLSSGDHIILLPQC